MAQALRDGRGWVFVVFAVCGRQHPKFCFPDALSWRSNGAGPVFRCKRNCQTF